MFSIRACRHPCGRVELDDIVLNLDVAPTLLDIAGLPAPPGVQGQSLLPLVYGRPPPWRSEFFYEHPFRNLPGGLIAASEGVRTQNWKYIRYIDQSPCYEQLFFLRTDPREENDLAPVAEHRARLDYFRQRWLTWRAALQVWQRTPTWTDPIQPA